MRTLKALTVTFFLCLSFSALSAELICGATKKELKRTYPINTAAIEFFSSLGLKACTGTTARDRIQQSVSEAKHTVSFVVVSREELKAAKAQMAKRGGGTGPSL